MCASLSFKGNGAVYLGKQGIVSSHSNILSWMKLGSHLSHQNIAGPYLLAAIFLHTTPLSIRIAAVSAGSLTFLMSHWANPHSVA